MATETVSIEQTRAQSLRDAESKATELFNEISKTLIRAGVSEKQISDEIHQLGKDKYGVRTHVRPSAAKKCVGGQVYA